MRVQSSKARFKKKSAKMPRFKRAKRRYKPESSRSTRTVIYYNVDYINHYLVNTGNLENDIEFCIGSIRKAVERSKKA